MAMEIQEKLLKFKYHIILALVLSIVLISVIVLAPSFLTILAYFWPLFLSTALFLVTVLFFGKTSAPASADSSPSAEGLLDYVAGHHGHHPAVELVQPHHPHHEASVETVKSESE
ncbi:hypothetical protein WN944_002250 [Citrus x changshan-huyou]|uniref:Uncharacterized protein n=4 Tax=Citrus TaxID=2706 RepID=A0ACB8P128_CITSI|nr:uncharacterized protein LOC18055132 [Citrus x clementina]ESR65819.1 hypothetical protein CICLE_v10009964mg [Citrus x clementina]KAH9804197.1 hypothetical protein KPL71_002044 [Citrus sinensis]KDO36999.1 hypothetical protein CISIN_1g033645mg [Citrus sinensis]